MGFVGCGQGETNSTSLLTATPPLRMEGIADPAIVPPLEIGYHGSKANFVDPEGPPRTVIPVGARRSAEQEERDGPS